MERYVYIRSDESKAYFSDNQVYRFKVHLNSPLSLNGTWRVALTEFYASENSKLKSADDVLYIYTDLCKESIVHGAEQPLLRRLEKNNERGWDYILDTPYYVPVKKTEAREFLIYIKSSSDTLATELKEPVYLTLHFKQYPFL